MSFILDFFKYEVAKTYEDPQQRQKDFEGRLESAQAAQADTRTFADLNAKPKYRFSHLRMNPFYEQRDKMFPHRRYTRREE